MPTTNKRINITVPENLYKRIEAYKLKNGVSSDAAACIQLIVKQLDGLDEMAQLMQIASKFSVDELCEISRIGIQDIKKLADKTQE